MGHPILAPNGVLDVSRTWSRKAIDSALIAGWLSPSLKLARLYATTSPDALRFESGPSTEFSSNAPD